VENNSVSEYRGGYQLLLTLLEFIDINISIIFYTFIPYLIILIYYKKKGDTPRLVKYILVAYAINSALILAFQMWRATF
jgi:hypothetical protein